MAFVPAIQRLGIEFLEMYRDDLIVMVQDAQVGIATIPSYVTVEVAE